MSIVKIVILIIWGVFIIIGIVKFAKYIRRQYRLFGELIESVLQYEQNEIKKLIYGEDYEP